MLDVHKNQPIYLTDPSPYIPERQSTRGKTPTRLQPNQLAVEVQQWADGQLKSAWEKMLVRNSTKGFIAASVVHREVWLWDGKEQQAHQWHLLINDTNLSKNNRKYSLQQCPFRYPNITVSLYARSALLGRELAIEDGKSHAGLADY